MSIPIFERLGYNHSNGTDFICRDIIYSPTGMSHSSRPKQFCVLKCEGIVLRIIYMTQTYDVDNAQKIGRQPMRRLMQSGSLRNLLVKNFSFFGYNFRYENVAAHRPNRCRPISCRKNLLRKNSKCTTQGKRGKLSSKAYLLAFWADVFQASFNKIPGIFA